MVDLATFRTFPRATPGRPSEAPVAERDVPVEEAIVTDEALSTRFSQELRARRRAARTGMRQSEVWVKPENVHAPADPQAEPLDRAFGLLDPREERSPEADPVKPRLPGAPRRWLHAQTKMPDAIGEEKLPYGGPAAVASNPMVRRNENEDLRRAPPLADEPKTATAPEPAVSHQRAAAVAVGRSFPEARPPLPSRPVPIREFLAEPIVKSGSVAPVVTPRLEAAQSVAPVIAAPPVDEPWPAEQPTALETGQTRAIEQHKPLSVETAKIAPVDAAPVLTLCENYTSDSLSLDYRLLGLANPLVVTVTGRLGDTTPTTLTVGRTGLYRPDGFRAAPWSGFAYDVSADGRTGLVLGTRILTSRGEISVEDLVPGDTVLALRGPALLPIVWIGRSIAVPPPVEIAANAFGPGRPSKTLRVGADHPIFVQTIPVPARELVNGGTIRNLETETAELFHIDVGFAEVLLADGVPLSSGCR